MIGVPCQSLKQGSKHHDIDIIKTFGTLLAMIACPLKTDSRDSLSNLHPRQVTPVQTPQGVRHLFDSTVLVTTRARGQKGQRGGPAFAALSHAVVAFPETEPTLGHSLTFDPLSSILHLYQHKLTCV